MQTDLVRLGLLDSGADFSIKYLHKLELFGQTLYLTTTHVGLLVVSLVLVILAIIVNRQIAKSKPEDTPGMLVNVFELAVDMLDNMVKGTMGINARRFRNWISTIFLFVLLCNVSGLFGLRPPTADYGITFALGVITFCIIHYNGIKANRAGHVTSMFKPILLSPINIIGEFAVPLSLSLRLFGNVMSGTVMMGLIYGLLPPPITTGLPSVLHVYFDLFSGCIQAYVFSMLSMVYISDKISTD